MGTLLKIVVKVAIILCLHKRVVSGIDEMGTEERGPVAMSTTTPAPARMPTLDVDDP